MSDHAANPSREATAEQHPFASLPQRERTRSKRQRRDDALPADPGDPPDPEATHQEPCSDAQDALHADAAGARQESGPGTSGHLQAVRYHDMHMPEYRTSAVGKQQFEYLDHTADVQLHAWGSSLEEAFENVALAMYNYMTPLEGIQIEPSLTREFEASGHDMESLLFAFLDELLFVFSTEFLVCKELEVRQLDRDGWKISAVGRGEHFDRQRHEVGTEIKAITFSAMQIRDAPGDAECFVIVDI